MEGILAKTEETVGDSEDSRRLEETVEDYRRL